jgi:hypothetical protein
VIDPSSASFRRGARCIALMLALLALETRAASPVGASKRLIEIGWDRPSPKFAKQHQKEMEERPFDGVVIALDAGGSLFQKHAFEAEKIEEEAAILATIAWQRFKDNFLILFAAADPGWDWFNDRDWAASEESTRLIAGAVRRANLRGICFDPEPYGVNPWKYASQPGARKHTFRDFAAKVRQRGARFAAAIEREAPSAVFFTLFQLSVLEDLVQLEGAARQVALAKSDFGLMVPFLEGMLQGSRLRIVDGDEWAYYAENSELFLQRAHTIRSRTINLIAPKLRAAYRMSVEVGQPIYLDQLLALRQEQPVDMPARFLTREEQLKWVEHNVYYALYTADQFAWFYSERIDFWRSEMDGALADALRRAKHLIDNDYPLEFSIDEMVKRARSKQVQRQ